MEKTLDIKLSALKKDPASRVFILADAKDADMAFGIAAPGRNPDGKLRSLAEYRDQMRQIVSQGLVDIMLMSASTSELLAIQERIFDASPVTPAARANDTTDVHIVRGCCYHDVASQPFASTTIDHIQAGKSPCTHAERRLGANLGLYSVTFNNDPECDLNVMKAYKAFRLEAEEKHFNHFLEVFHPNVPAHVHGILPEQIPYFVNDHIARLLAGVPSSSRPLFLKIPYAGPKALEELCAYDSSQVVGVLGGSAGTTHDAFTLVHDAKLHGARVALFGRKINAAEHQLSFVHFLRLVADDQVLPAEAVKAYHGALQSLGITPLRALNNDLELTSTFASYAGG
ncbi:MAG: hypothetical protein ABR956_05650 [Terracidiphilus sp.]|jgi:hypothetical protein